MAAMLKLVAERKLADLIQSDKPVGRYEASGVLVKDGRCFVVFDDRSEIARLSGDLQANSANGRYGEARVGYGYEGITYNDAKRRFYFLVESRKSASGCYNAVIVECDDDFRYLKERPIDFPFENDNKGFEAVAHFRRGDVDYLLALCEGNRCRCGAKGRKPGGGRIQVFRKKRKRWKHVRAVALPRRLPFVDYSGMSVDGDRVAVVSQESSMLWAGKFQEGGWGWRDEGDLYEFPRADDGALLYGNIEGVAWIAPTRVIAVSDRRKKRTQPDQRLSDKDQSVHIFDIPS